MSVFVLAGSPAAVDAIVAHAKAHVYEPDDMPPPGDDPRHVLYASPYRVVFSFTRLQGALYRHLSISCAGGERKPSHTVAIAFANAFGFDGHPADWNGGLVEGNVGILMQEIGEEALR